MIIVNKIKNKIWPSKQSQRVKPWFKVKGDKTLRLNYDLNENSTVFDMGGFEGQWASDIFSKYLCDILIFEPFIPFALDIRERFQKNSKVKVFDFGLGNGDISLDLFADSDSTSTFKKKGSAHSIRIKQASTFIKENNIGFIDLMKINIEGGEFDLLEELIESDLIKNIDNIQVQFHDFVPNAYSRMRAIQAMLSKTHELTYQFEFVWENWRLKK